MLLFTALHERLISNLLDSVYLKTLKYAMTLLHPFGVYLLGSADTSNLFEASFQCRVMFYFAISREH